MLALATTSETKDSKLLGIQACFVARTGSALDTVERGGKPRHSLRAAIRMPKRNKDDVDYGTQWVTLQIREFGADYARGIPVGTAVVVTGKLRTNVGEDGRTFFDVDVDDIQAFPKGEKKTDEPSW